MSSRKIVIYSDEDDSYNIKWSSYLKENITFVNSVEIIDYFLKLINKKVNVINLYRLTKWLVGEININYVNNGDLCNVLLKYKSNVINFNFNKTLKLDIFFFKRNTELRRFINLIELEIIKQCPVDKKLVLISNSIKSTSNKDIYLIAFYSLNKSKDVLKTILADYYIDCSSTNWIELTIEVLLYEFKKRKIVKYFSTVDYKKFFANKETNIYIEQIRNYICPKILEIATKIDEKFDQFDLEIQVLISSISLDRNALFLGNSKKLNLNTLDILILKQLSVILDRYKKFNNKLPVKELLTPSGIFKSKTRYWYDENKIYALPFDNGFVDKEKTIEIEFKEVDKEIATDYENCFHYIHNDRNFSKAFGLYIKGNKYPYAISILDFLSYRENDFKIKFLNQAGINKHQCVDEIRLYSFPWVPMLTSSLLAELVRKYLIVNFPNITSSITAVNRNLFKGTYINQTGYIPIALKPTIFKFGEIKIDNKIIKFYQGSKGKPLNKLPFPLLPTTEYYRSIKKTFKIRIPEGNVLKIRPNEID